MDFISAVLLGALNVPVLLISCRLFRRSFFKEEPDFWRSLLAWSFDPQGFFDQHYRRYHYAVLFISAAFAACIALVFLEYEGAHRLMEYVRSVSVLARLP